MENILKQVHTMQNDSTEAECADSNKVLYNSNNIHAQEKAHANSKSTSFTNLQKMPFDADVHIISKIGSGAFGCVYTCTYNSKPNFCVKRVHIDKTQKNREIGMMRWSTENTHPNIIHMIDCAIDKHSYYIVMPMYSLNLRQFLSTQFRLLDKLKVRSFIRSIIRGILHLHSHKIIHRDFKPENILIEGNKLIICDLGASKYEYDTPHTTYICTRYYRAPEVILGNNSYTCTSDLWSVGCVLFELFTNQILFYCTTTYHLLSLIFKLNGTPTKEEFMLMNDQLESGLIHKLRKINRKKPQVRQMSNMLSSFVIDDDLYYCMECCLSYDPENRKQLFQWNI